ncbi:aspartate kinase, partial [Lactobacillus crispatus]
VCEGIRQKHTIIRQIIDSLGDHDISPQMINQGASQISIMIGTKKEKADEAVKIIYQKFFN